MILNTPMESQNEVIDVIMNADYDVDVIKVLGICDVELTGMDGEKLIEHIEDLGFKGCSLNKTLEEYALEAQK